nr:alpha/beta fold hydrolase [Achromobacter xylosoxidans]
MTLAIQESGDPAGPAIVFVHGLLGSRLSWEAQLSSPLLQRYRLIAYDLRGHGQSGKPTAPQAYTDGRRWADDLAAVIAASGARQAVESARARLGICGVGTRAVRGRGRAVQPRSGGLRRRGGGALTPVGGTRSVVQLPPAGADRLLGRVPMSPGVEPSSSTVRPPPRMMPLAISSADLPAKPCSPATMRKLSPSSGLCSVAEDSSTPFERSWMRLPTRSRVKSARAWRLSGCSTTST